MGIILLGKSSHKVYYTFKHDGYTHQTWWYAKCEKPDCGFRAKKREEWQIRLRGEAHESFPHRD